MKNFLLIACLFVYIFDAMAQDTTKDMSSLPYAQIPDYPEKYTAGSVASRLIDGLGFRYYWATDSLNEQDLSYKPNSEARSTFETIDHIYGLSTTIINAVTKHPNIRSQSKEKRTFLELRAATLKNLMEASKILRSCNDEDLEDFSIVFESSSGRSEFPFWNNLNGPIADALWHTGQVVSFRRSSGNPFNSKVSLFNGKLRD